MCSGTYEEAAYEDTLAAGALADRLWDRYGEDASDAAQLARTAWLAAREDGFITSLRHEQLLTESAAALRQAASESYEAVVAKPAAWAMPTKSHFAATPAVA